MTSPAQKAPALIVSQIGEPDRATGAVDYRAALTESDRPITLSFTLPRDGLITKMGDAMFRYTPMPRVNAESDTFTVIARDRSGAAAHATVTWINDNGAPVAVAPPTVWPPHPETGAVTVSPNIVDPDGDSLTFTLDAPYPMSGEVAIDRDGTFTYVPFPFARDHTMLAEETFGFRAVDSRGASAYITVTVPITPRTLAPAPPAGPAMCAPDPFTGVVIGTCAGADCTYAASAPAKGAVLIDAATGTWAYRPTAAARHDAIADDATDADQHDSFTVTISDNDGGTTELTLTVSLVTMITVP